MKRIPTVKFDASRLTATVLAEVELAVRELPEVTRDKFDDVYDLTVRACARGGDMYLLSTGLMEMGLRGMSRERASQVSRELWFRAKDLMDRERQAKLGVTRARWRYVNAPCMIDPGNPSAADSRRNAAHKAADGKVYVIADGLLIDGKRSWPGREPGCKCSSRPIIPGDFE
jgi:uncharacterized protein with gpF-like domain